MVIPARDEEDRIAACLEALAGQVGVEPRDYEVLLVLDHCRDRTAERAAAVSRAHPALRLETLGGPGLGAGPARALGMDTACVRLESVGRPRGLIASTDADSVVARDWLAAQLAAAERGARAIGGRIELCPRELRTLPDAVVREHARSAGPRLRRVLEAEGRAAEHWQFSGASMALTAEAYAQVGGIEECEALEDERLEAALRTHGVRIERLRSVRVTTSARTVGRASAGLAADLALAVRRERTPSVPDDPGVLAAAPIARPIGSPR